MTIELRGSFLVQSSSSDPTAFVCVTATTHLEEISCNLDRYPVVTTIKLASSLNMTSSIASSGAAYFNYTTTGRFIADEINIAASGSWGRGFCSLVSSGVCSRRVKILRADLRILLGSAQTTCPFDIDDFVAVLVDVLGTLAAHLLCSNFKLQ